MENFLVLLGIITATVIVSWILEFAGTNFLLEDLPYWTEALITNLNRSSVIVAGITLAVGMAIYGLLWYFRWGDDDEKQRNKKRARKQKQKAKNTKISQEANDLVWRYKGTTELHKRFVAARKNFNEAQVKKLEDDSVDLGSFETKMQETEKRLIEAEKELDAIEKEAVKLSPDDFKFLV